MNYIKNLNNLIKLFYFYNHTLLSNDKMTEINDLLKSLTLSHQ